MRTLSVKSITSIALLIVTLVSCHSPAYISGHIEGSITKDVKLYLIEPDLLNEVAASYFGRVIDSAVVYPDGSFEFRNLPTSKNPMLLELVIQTSGKTPNYKQTDDPTSSNYMPLLWQLGEPLYVTAKLESFQKSLSIQQPSEVNKALLDLRDINQNAYQTHLAGKEWQLEDGKELLEKEQAVLQYRNELITFADSTKYLMPALVALRWVSPVNDYERVPEFLVEQCTKWKQQPEHPWVEQLCKQSELSNLPVLVGNTFPNLELPTINKDTLLVNNQLGNKLTIIDLWASWCAPCRIENREILVPLWDDYHDQGLQIIAYSLESDASAWKTAVERDGADRWIQASELQGDDAPFLKKIRIQTIPANFILDDKGVVIAKNIHGKALVDLVKSYMQN
ncbi:TlpA family protein disulfide reductase [Pontimicrobium aquaticum]|uniref:TlpA family protein disulfide reductase n=1 Tax=Pontimicrobium aquaticum TaxID=2565367 RepID=A0A4V5LQP0_9FLAO|nr:TlpA disulfide reductase family protein [Pontimicrobium aquaticum]TJY35999.1 TlpA family protein disulfide reductase [Pontimicrobium aquaticum]